MKFLGIIIIAILLMPAAYAMDANDPDFQMLANIEIFAFGGVGYGGNISAGEKAYRQIFPVLVL